MERTCVIGRPILLDIVLYGFFFFNFFESGHQRGKSRRELDHFGQTSAPKSRHS